MTVRAGRREHEARESETERGMSQNVTLGRSGFAAGWGKPLSRSFNGEGPDLRKAPVDTLEFPAAVAGAPWPPSTKGYHDDRAPKAHDPGHAARRPGRRDPTRVSAGRSPTGRLLHDFARSAQRAAGRGLPPLRPR